MSRSPRTLAVAGGVLLLLLLLGVSRKFRSDRSETGDRRDLASSGSVHPDGLGGHEGTRFSNRPIAIDNEEVQRLAEARYLELLARHPEFEVTFKNIPDDENGYLAFLNFAEELSLGDIHGAVLPLSDELRGMLGGDTPLEVAVLENWIQRYPDLFQSMLRIAELPGQSIAGRSMERYQFPPARLAKEMNDLLMASVEAAMASGDTDEALRRFEASVNFANHFDGVEIRSSIWTSTSVLLRSVSLERFCQHVLPEIVGQPEVLARWKQALPPLQTINETGPAMVVGEWHIMTRMYLLPTMISPGSGNSISLPPIDRAEQDAVLESYTSQMGHYIDRYATESPLSLMDRSKGFVQHDPSLSAEGNEYLEAVRFDISVRGRISGEWSSRMAQHHALLSVALGEAPGLEPVTGEPFVWNPQTSVLSPPAGLVSHGIKLEPRQLPSTP